MVRIILCVILLFCQTAFAIEVDTDGNGAIDVDKGGTNTTSASGIRTLINVESGAQPNPTTATQEEAEAGTETALRSWSPKLIADAIAALAASASSFLGLSDTPSSYTGQGGKVVSVKSDESGLEFSDAGAGTGDVVGPASATDGNLAVFDRVTGKLIKDGGPPFTGLDVPAAETDPVFSAWYATFDPFETGDETDPVFSAWLIATPPLYVEVDPGVGTHESTYDHTLISTALQAETDPSFNAWLIATPPLFAETDPIFSLWDRSTGISITESQISDFGTYLTAESDPTVDTSAEIQAIIGAGVYQPAGSYLTSLSGAVLTDQTTSQTIGTTDNRLAMCWATDLTVTNAINGSVTGNAGTVTNGVYTGDAGTVFLSPTGDGSGLAGVLKAEVDGSTTNEIQTIDTAQLSGTKLQLSLSSDGEAVKEVELSSLQDGTGTDDQTAAEVPASTTNFNALLGATEDTMQKVADKLDDITIPTVDDTAYDATSWDNNTDAPTKNAIRDKIETLPGGHDAVTLSATIDSNLLVLTTQEIGLDTQTANTVFAGPASGSAAAPTFRSLVADDIPDLSGTYVTGTPWTSEGYLTAEVDGSTSNEINTITGDDSNTTSGLAITIAGAGTVATSVSGDTVTITGTGDGTGTDDQTASEVSTTTTSFGGILTNDANSNDVQKCLDKIDDHNHSGTYVPTTEMPAIGNDPDVSTAGHIGRDNNDNSLRGYDGTNQFVYGQKLQRLCGANVILPNDLADATRDKCIIGTNNTPFSFVVTKIVAYSDTDDADVNVEEYDADGSANNATVDAVTCTTGSGPYTATETTITGATIEAGHIIALDFDDTDTPGYVAVDIWGYYNGDVN